AHRVELVALERGPALRADHLAPRTLAEQELLERQLVLEALLLLAALDLDQRRLRDEQMTLLDELGHLAVEEREQERADVAPVDVGVRHDDQPPVAQARLVEVGAGAAPERRDDR